MAMPRLGELWGALRVRLDTSRMRTILGGSQRVYYKSDDYSRPEDARNRPWGRLVFGQTTTVWPAVEQQGATERLSINVRAEFNDFAGAGYDVNVALDAAQSEAYAALQGWSPASFTYVLVALPMYRQSAVNDEPLWDDSRGLWMTAVEYRCEIAAGVAVCVNPFTSDFSADFGCGSHGSSVADPFTIDFTGDFGHG